MLKHVTLKQRKNFNFYFRIEKFGYTKFLIFFFLVKFDK